MAAPSKPFRFIGLGSAPKKVITKLGLLINTTPTMQRTLPKASSRPQASKGGVRR